MYLLIHRLRISGGRTEGYTLTSCLNTLTSRISLPSCIVIDFYRKKEKERKRDEPNGKSLI